ncbi:hypothetical protein [Natronolimnohabitans innermongolicus]|uniref:Uncharacterized protein n=1 Tax=Natronolimnohabitans innermongolicus JCM 12255 TaxID=1227499 RepID=L9XKG8_9EURY|nr:hypothetical protein [Natronolimnohabitans innermongolicus]ELY61916.1 hypothetical protein C493_01510 [Natronolimnohabitans innermongolicus JCM 12255]
MDRRRFIATGAATATVTLAGCVFGGSEELDAELEDEETASFEADEGDEFEVTVEAEADEVDVEIHYDLEASAEDADDEEDVESALEGAYSGPVLSETVDGEETFEIEVDADGHYDVEVRGGTAQVTID